MSASWDMTLRIWNNSTKSCLSRIDTECELLQVAYVLNGEAIAGFGNYNETIYTYKTPKVPLPYHQDQPAHRGDGVKLLHFSPSGNLIASVGQDCIHVWSILSCDRVRTLLTSADYDKSTGEQRWEPQVVNFSAQEQMLAAGGPGGIVMVWNLHSSGETTPGQSIVMKSTEEQFHKAPLWKSAREDPDSVVESVAFSPAGDKLISGGKNKYWEQLTFSIWDVIDMCVLYFVS